MRVIAGSARGLHLAAPRGMLTRPTADRVREALFSIIQSRCDLNGMHVLDICAGTGGLGIEALSRGAAGCCFIDNDRSALTCLRRNLETTGFSAAAQVLEMNAVKALQLLAAKKQRFDLIFFDPPYASTLYSSVPDEVCSKQLLEVDGLFIAESASRTLLPERLGALIKTDHRAYGDTALDMYQLEAA